eukprot:jgi/Botrbrau1/9498/Bobra.0252s0113.1
MIHTRDVAAYVGNISSSVFIIFVNKRLMGRKGFGFEYATTLCALHYFACTAAMGLIQPRSKIAPRRRIPLSDLMLFTLVADLSIISLNTSLMLNPVGFYQIAKLLVIPFICAVECLWLGRSLSGLAVLSILTVVIGVAIVTVTDFVMTHNVLGLCIAGMSVVCSGMQQILCRVMQQKHALSSTEFLAMVAPAQGWSLLLAGPLLDKVVSRSWVWSYPWTLPALGMLALSCTAAVGVNISQFLCLGRFSAMTFQVMGHMKTVAVLLVGWAFLGDVITQKQCLGMGIAILGMVMYGIATAGPPKPAEPKKME